MLPAPCSQLPAPCSVFREYIWLVTEHWPAPKERERMANYRTPSQVAGEATSRTAGTETATGTETNETVTSLKISSADSQMSCFRN